MQYQDPEPCSYPNYQFLPVGLAFMSTDIAVIPMNVNNRFFLFTSIKFFMIFYLKVSKLNLEVFIIKECQLSIRALIHAFVQYCFQPGIYLWLPIFQDFLLQHYCVLKYQRSHEYHRAPRRRQLAQQPSIFPSG